MKQIKKIQWELVRFYRLWLGCRLERWYGAVRYPLVVRPRLDIKVWRQFGCPVEYVPRRAFLIQFVVGGVLCLLRFLLLFAWVCVLVYVLFGCRP